MTDKPHFLALLLSPGTKISELIITRSLSLLVTEIFPLGLKNFRDTKEKETADFKIQSFKTETLLRFASLL